MYMYVYLSRHCYGIYGFSGFGINLLSVHVCVGLDGDSRYVYVYTPFSFLF